MVHWYKRDPDAALVGMLGLTPEERGIYNTLLDLLYARDGNVPNDDRFMAVAQQCDPRTWRCVRDRLIAKGKIWITADNLIGAKRVESTLREAREFAERQSNVAKKRWKSTTEGMPRGNASTTTTTIKKDLASFGTTSEYEPPKLAQLEEIQPTRYLIESEISTRPRPPGLLTSALVGSAFARPAVAAAELPSEMNGHALVQMRVNRQRRVRQP